MFIENSCLTFCFDTKSNKKVKAEKNVYKKWADMESAPTELLYADFLRSLFEIGEFIPLHTEGMASVG